MQTYPEVVNFREGVADFVEHFFFFVGAADGHEKNLKNFADRERRVAFGRKEKRERRESKEGVKGRSQR
jgi:hypothetical protein